MPNFRHHFPSFFRLQKRLRKQTKHWPWTLIAVLLTTFAFSSFLMFRTFSYQDGQIVLALKIWSDFWANIPLIRSFSYGSNFPDIQYPIFPGERIRYHFLFFAMVGLLERVGVRIDWAINSISIIGLTGVLTSVFILTRYLTKSRLAGWLAILLVCFNPSLSWLYYLNGDRVKIETPIDIITNKEFAVTGPYDGQLISMFWTLNVFTNQRHLVLSLLYFFLIIWSTVYAKRKSWSALSIFLLLLLSWQHKAILLMSLLALGWFWVCTPKRRWRICLTTSLGLFLSIPGLWFLNGDGLTGKSSTQLQFGFLSNAGNLIEFPSVTDPLLRFGIYWIFNLGLLPLITVLGYVWIVRRPAPKSVLRRSLYFVRFSSHRLPLIQRLKQAVEHPAVPWFASAVTFFVIANTFQFAPDVGTNHKFINLTILIFSCFAGGWLAFLFHKKKLWSILIASVVLIGLTLGGIFDFFPVVNDGKYIWKDIARDNRSQWIQAATPKDSVFLNTSFDTNHITITGRKIYWGWNYFTWGIGYDLPAREKFLQPILTGNESPNQVCKKLTAAGIDYINLDLNNQDTFIGNQTVNVEYFKEHFNHAGIAFERVIIYDLKIACQKYL